MRRTQPRQQQLGKPVFSSRRQETSEVTVSGSEGEDLSVNASNDVSDEKSNSMPNTNIDRAHAAMTAGGETELISFYRSVADSELHIILEEANPTEVAEPRLQMLDGSQYVLAVDQKDRIFGLAGEGAPTSRIYGRDLFNLIRGRGIHVAINIGVAPSEMVIPDHAIDWICEMLDDDEEKALDPAVASAAEKLVPATQNGKFKALLAPHNIPDTLLVMLNEKLHHVAKFIDTALLLRAEYVDRPSGFVIAFSGVEEAHREIVTVSVTEALVAARRNDLVLDIVFLQEDDPSLVRLSRLATHLIPKGTRSKDGKNMDLPFILQSSVDKSPG